MSPTAKPTLPSALTESALADELGRRLQRKAFEKLDNLDRLKDLETEARARFEEEDAFQEFRLTGEKWIIKLGMKENERTITSMWKLFKATKLKTQEFIERCKMALKDVDALVPEEKRKGIVEQDRTGSRSITPVERPKAA